MQIQKCQFFGLEALAFEAGGYEALLVPSMGANLVKLDHLPTSTHVLRTPTEEEIETFKARPQIFGLPLLFPPNRIADGCYTFENRTYQYPITIPEQNNYHHGIIKSEPFVVTREEVLADRVIIEATYESTPSEGNIYKNFPHAFTCTMVYDLSAEGLKQTTIFSNRSTQNMPLGVGFHTPINIPFGANKNKADYRIRLSVGKRWEVCSRTLPTGRLLDLVDELPLRTEGIRPCEYPIEWALTNEPMMIDDTPYSGAIITDMVSGKSVWYEVDENYRHWTLWNNGAAVDYICPEPQTWAINAPNLSLSDAVTGFRYVEPETQWEGVTRLYVK